MLTIIMAAGEVRRIITDGSEATAEMARILDYDTDSVARDVADAGADPAWYQASCVEGVGGVALEYRVPVEEVRDGPAVRGLSVKEKRDYFQRGIKVDYCAKNPAL